MRHRNAFNVFVLSSALLIGIGPYIVKAAGTRPESVVANVDMQRVFAESDVKRGIEQKLTEYGAQLGQRFDEVSRTAFLSADEISDLSRILNTDKPTDADTKKLAQIKAEAQKRADDFQRLSAIKQPQPAEVNRMRELDTMQRQRPLYLDRLQKLYQQEIDQEEQKRMRAGMAEVRGIVTKMAREQGFTEVYDITALVVAPADLTDQALKKVQTKKR